MTKSKQQAKATKETIPATESTTSKPEPIKTAAKTEVAKNTKIKAVKVEKPIVVKTPKIKMIRDSFTIPKDEYAQLELLKERLISIGKPAKKSELLRAGIMLLTAMTDAKLKASLSVVPTIKTGRPAK
jgi:hypothetical protein